MLTPILSQAHLDWYMYATPPSSHADYPCNTDVMTIWAPLSANWAPVTSGAGGMEVVCMQHQYIH
jgi:hypothetical protein